MIFCQSYEDGLMFGEPQLKQLVVAIWMDAVLAEIDTIRREVDRTRRGNPLCVLVLGMRAQES